MDIEQKIIDLETRIAYQDVLIAQLNDIVYKQQKQLDAFEARVKKQFELLADDADHIAPFNLDLDKPPHF